MPDTERGNWEEICPYYPIPPSKELTHFHSHNRHQSIFKDRSLITKSSTCSNLKYYPLTLSLAIKFYCELWRVYLTCRTYHWDQIKQFPMNVTAVPKGAGDDEENNTFKEVIVDVLLVLTVKQIHKLTLFNKLHADEEIQAWQF